MILGRPKIGLYQAWLFIIEGEIGKALPLLNDLRQHLADRDAPSAEPWIQTVVDSALAFLGRPAVARGSAPLPAAPLPAAPLPEYALLEEIPAGEPILRNVADYLYGMALARRGELDRAAEVAVGCIQRETERSAALPHGTASRGTPVIPTLAPFLSRVYLMQGRLHAAAALCREFLDPLKEKGIRFIYTSGSMKIDLGEVLYEWNCLEEAEQHIRDGLQTNEPWKNIMTDGFGYSALARVLQAKGDPAGALQTVERFETRLLEHSMPREFDEDLRTLRVRLQLGSGDVQAAADWADQVLLSEDFRLHEAYYRLTLARIRLAQGRHAEVEKWLAGMAPTAWAGSLITRQLESNLLLAAAAAGQDRLPEAFGWIEACLALAEPEGYIHVFLDAGETARDLLAAYLRTEAPGHTLYAQKILEAFSLSRGTGSPESPSGGRPAGGPSGRSAGRPSGLVEPLSERELEVLQLIALGRTNPEIARQLVVSPGTVKAHSASIYRKLDVANRTEAVARARQLGILL
jgi:LuxR family maltose regulon positive regulatory protein